MVGGWKRERLSMLPRCVPGGNAPPYQFQLCSPGLMVQQVAGEMDTAWQRAGMEMASVSSAETDRGRIVI